MAYDEVKFIADLFRIGVELHRSGSDTDAFQVETAALEVERLLAENRQLRGRAERAEAALRPFAVFLAWIEAAAEVGDLDPITDQSCVTSIHPGGGSHYLWVGDFRRAAEAIAGLDAAPAPAGDPANPPLKLHWEQRRMTRCQADEDDCDWEHCPQIRDGEPRATGRHCPLDREEGNAHDD
jgi:hypothetical protein